jgi:D-beta-D-heptose 7-phosphate kinase/D-beta-D-heptose 1-phosphate adenosyltransferase
LTNTHENGSAPSVPDFSRLRVAVVGDLVADHYLYASPRRLSREAPVMVLAHEREEVGAGGAANVARNLRALGAQVSIHGVAGKDSSGRELRRLLEAHGIDTAGLALQSGWTTPAKTRVLAAEPRRSLQQVLRIDREPSKPADAKLRRGVVERVRGMADSIDALLVADYEYGMVCTELAQVVRELAAGGLPVLLDPRDLIDQFAGVTALTPNMAELARFAAVSQESLDEPGRLREVAKSIRKRVRARYLLVTCGNKGMALFGEDVDPEGIAVDAWGSGEVTDVCGAGDTAAAVFALALAMGLEPTCGMVLANAASGVVCMEHGAAMCSPAQLRAALPLAPAAKPLGGRVSYV